VALATPFFWWSGGSAWTQGAYAFRKDAKAPSMAAQRGPFVARDALLQAYAPFA